jgi:hypothetical protein
MMLSPLKKLHFQEAVQALIANRLYTSLCSLSILFLWGNIHRRRKTAWLGEGCEYGFG